MKSSKYPAIAYYKMAFEESRYQRGDKWWYASTLLRACHEAELEPFEYPVACYDMASKHFSLDDMYDFVWQMKRVLEADYEKYPIILDNYGNVADGNHRICHAILDGKTSVLAYRLQTMPEPDFIKEES